MKELKEKYQRAAESKNGYMCIIKPEEARQVLDLIGISEEMFLEMEKHYQARKNKADWFNNNTPGVGQEIDYAPQPQKTQLFKKLEQLLKQ